MVGSKEGNEEVGGKDIWCRKRRGKRGEEERDKREGEEWYENKASGI